MIEKRIGNDNSAKHHTNMNGGDKKAEFQNSGTPLPRLHTDREIEKQAGVSHDTVHKVSRVFSVGWFIAPRGLLRSK